MNKECSTCEFFEYTDFADQGKCKNKNKKGITYGRYICPEWRSNADGVSHTVYGFATERGNVAPSRYKKPNSNVGNSGKADVLRADRDLEKLKEKEVNYDNNDTA